MPKSSDFFDELEEQSAVKAQIVVNYFVAWSRIMATRAERIGYFDFFAGPGRYKSGQTSTPLLILKHALAHDDLSARLVTLFNDANPEFTRSLEGEIERLDGIERLAHRPQVITSELTDDLISRFKAASGMPTLSFIDPWGYKGLSQRLIRTVIKDWGCDVIFFFNYNRISMGIPNDIVESHMTALFGEDRLHEMQSEIESLNPEDRETRIRRALGEALEEMGADYLIPFRFRREQGRVSHHVCFVSKHPLGYRIMKDIMASHGAVDEDGVPLFEYLQSTGGRQLAFNRPRPLLSLPENLISTFAGETIRMGDIYERHNVGTPFISKNYKDVLKVMEANGDIMCSPNKKSSKRRKNTIADWVKVTFPPA